MAASPARIRWSPRVPPHKIRRLYESDAQGMLDEELLDEVGWSIYARCQDLLEVEEANAGRVRCRNCGHTIVRRGVDVGPAGDKAEVLRCGQCSWQVTWGEYYRSLLGQGLLACGGQRMFAPFVEQWPRARSPREKLLSIDRLIHEFHVVQFGLGRTAGANVIEGTERQVAEFIDGLAYGAASTPGLRESRRLWSARLNAPERRLTVSDLRAIARELGIRGVSRMRKRELIEAIRRLDPQALERSGGPD